MTGGDHRIDLDKLRAAVSVPDVLVAEGLTLRGRRCACPIHADCNNRTAFSVSRDGTKFYCFVCAEGGDVLRLVERLHGCDFRTAVAHVAALGGVQIDGLRLDQGAATRRATARRRQQALERWRVRRLTETADHLRELEDEAEWLGSLLTRDANTPNADVWWQHLAEVRAAIDLAELTLAQLEDGGPVEWASIWLAHRSRVAA